MSSSLLKLVSLLLLAVGGAVAQTTIPPYQIRPGVNGQCLTTVAGQTTWATCAGGGSTGYNLIQSAGVSLAQRQTVNFLGSLSCVDNPGQGRTDCSLVTPLPVVEGGTGLTTLTAHVLYVGNGTSTPNAISPGTSGQVLESGGPGVDPTFQDPIVSGPDAPGVAPTRNPVQVGAFDGTNVQRVKSDTSGNLSVNVQNFPATQAVSAASLPLPSGAASSTNQTNGTQQTQVTDGAGHTQPTGDTSARTIHTTVDNASVAVTVTSLPLPAGAAQDATLTGGTLKAEPFDGTNVIGTATHPVQVSLANTAANSNAVKVDGSGVTQPVSGTVSVNALPSGSNTIGKVDLLGNAGAVLDSAGQNATSPANELLVAGQFNTTPTTITSGNVSPLQLDASGNLNVNIKAGGGSGGTSSTFGATFPSTGTAAGASDGTNMKPLLVDGSGSLKTNCISGCSAAGDQTTSSMALGALNAAINITLAGERGAAFQLQSGGTGVYTVTPECSFDGGVLYNVDGYIQDPFLGTFSTTATIASAQGTTDYQVLCPAGASHARMIVTAYTSGTANWLARATVNTWQGLTFPVIAGGQVLTSGQVSTPALDTQGGLEVSVINPTGTPLRTAASETIGTRVEVNAALRLKDTTQSTGSQLVGAPGDATNGLFVNVKAGAVTANAGTGTFTTSDANLVSQGSTTSGEKGPLAQGAVTNSAPSYTTAQTDPLSLDTSGNLRTSVNNTVTVNNTQQGTASQNVAQFGGNSVVTGTGTGGSGIPRVTVSSDSSLTANQGTAAVSTAGWPITSGNLAETTAAWTSATTVNTALTLTVTGYNSINVYFNQTTTLTGGVATFEGSDTTGFTNAYPVQCTQGNSFTTAGTYTFVASTNQQWDCDVSAFIAFRVRLSTVISGTGTVNVGLEASAGATVPEVSVGGKVSIDQTTPGTTNAVAVTNLPTTVDTNTGNASASTLREAVATNNPAISAWGHGATGSAVPANATQVGGTDGTNLIVPFIDPCQRAARTRVAISITANTQEITGASSKQTYICDLDIVVGAATNVALVEGTGTTCGTTTAGMAGGATAATGWNFAANGGLTKGNGQGWVYKTNTAADNVCLFVSAANQVSGSLSWVQF